MGDVNYRFEAATVFVPLIALIAILLALRASRSKAGARWGWRFVPVRLAAAVYIAGVLGLTLFPFQILYGKWADAVTWYDQVNWLPLITLDPSAIPNTALTVPLGILLPLISGRVVGTRQAVVYGAVFSLAVETLQVLCVVLFNNYRQADVNDILVNTLGCVLGYWLVRLAVKVSFLRRTLGSYALPGSALANAPRGIDAATGDLGRQTA